MLVMSCHNQRSVGKVRHLGGHHKIESPRVRWTNAKSYMLVASEGGKNCLHWSKDNAREYLELLTRPDIRGRQLGLQSSQDVIFHRLLLIQMKHSFL